MIVDASVALKWLIKEENSAMANALLTMPGLAAPELVLSQVGNALWKKRLRGELEAFDVRADGLLKLFARIVPVAPLIDRALVLAVRLAHPVYDCIYLTLAEIEDVPLVTADARFTAVCRANGFGSRLRALGDGT